MDTFTADGIAFNGDIGHDNLFNGVFNNLNTFLEMVIYKDRKDTFITRR